MSTTFTVRLVLLVSEIAGGGGVGPSTIIGGELLSDPPGSPSTRISASPMFKPTAWSTRNSTQVVTFGANVTAISEPSAGNGPTEIALPSLNSSRPARMLSTPLGRSCKLTCDTLIGLVQVSLIHAPANCPMVAHSFV